VLKRKERKAIYAAAEQRTKAFFDWSPFHAVALIYETRKLSFFQVLKEFFRAEKTSRKLLA